MNGEVKEREIIKLAERKGWAVDRWMNSEMMEEGEWRDSFLVKRGWIDREWVQESGESRFRLERKMEKNE